MNERMSYSSMRKLLKCENAWAYEYLRNLRKIQWKEEFEVGDAFQLGIYRLMGGHPLNEVLTMVRKFVDKRMKQLRAEFSMSTKDEQIFVEMKTILEGMLTGYAKRYQRDLGVERHIANEFESIIKISKGVRVLIKLDNIIAISDKWYVHEGKAWRSLSDQKVEDTKSSFQTATYFHAHNIQMEREEDKEIIVGKDRMGNPIKVKGKPFSGIIFDVVVKPSIRLKIGESYRGYLVRLQNYYQGPDASSKFFKEVTKEPMIDRKSWINTVNECASRMSEMREGRRPLKTYNDCGWCDFYEPCYHGEKKSIMAMFKQKEVRK